MKENSHNTNLNISIPISSSITTEGILGTINFDKTTNILKYSTASLKLLKIEEIPLQTMMRDERRDQYRPRRDIACSSVVGNGRSDN